MVTWNVLVIEDDEDNRFLLVNALKLCQHQVMGVADGAIGLKLLQDQAFDIVYCDVQMPILSGWDVIQQIRQHTNLRVAQTLVVAISGHVADLSQLQAAGFDDLLIKPIDAIKLQRQSSVILQQWRKKHNLSSSNHK
jgi:CheY-like chemotaxis protein